MFASIVRIFCIALAGFVMLSCSNEAVQQVGVLDAVTVDDQSTVRKVAITNVVAKMRRGTDIGVFQSGWLCTDRQRQRWRTGGTVGGYYTEELIDVFREELERNGWPVAGSFDNLFEGFDVSGAELLIAGKLSEIESVVCQPDTDDNEYQGSMRIKVEWQIYNPARRAIIGEVTTEGSSLLEDEIVDGSHELFLDSFAVAVNNLLASSEFLEMAQKVSFVTSPSPDRYYSINNRLIRFGSIDEALQHAERGTVVIRVAKRHGSGFAIGEGELVITNAHVIGDAETVLFITSDGIEVPGKLVAIDQGRDVALIEVEGVRLPAIHIATIEPSLAETVYAIGAPYGEDLQGTVTEGIISSMRLYDGHSWIQSDAAINPGNSGGPLLNKQGSIIGISTQIYTPSGGPTDLNMFVPINNALDYLGVSIEQ